jgi:diguanylate cyclase (GGDEF)-like protein/PAS domain S-box-containing protein
MQRLDRRGPTGEEDPVPSRLLTVLFGAWMAVLTVLYYLFPSWHMIIWGAIGLSSASAVAVGVLVHRPRRRLPWLLLCAALLTFGGGDATYSIMNDLLGMENPFPSFADVFYLAMYPLLAAGLLGFIRLRSGGHERGSLLDAVTLTAGLGLLSWIFLIAPYVRDDSLTFLERLTSVAYPLGDVLTIATLARLLTGGRRMPAVSLLGLGVGGLLIADVLYGLIQINGDWHVGGPVDLGWALFYAAWGAAALHPSMVRLTEPTVLVTTEVGNRRLVLLGGASLIAPAVLLIESINGPVRDAPVIAVLSGVLFLLVLARLAGVVATHRQAVARERGLREAGAALVSATDLAEVTGAVRQAVVELLPPDTPHVVLLVSDSAPPDGPAAAPRTAELVRAVTLPDGVGAAIGEFAAVLRCPLPPHGPLSDRSVGGMLYVAAPEAALLALPGSLEVLTSQAGLALDRIALTDEVNRRNSEAYFRTLVHNTSDVIVIVDDDDRIRYVSPSAATVFGTDALVGVRLDALVTVAERARLGEMLQQVRAGMSAQARVDYQAQRSNGTSLQVEVDCRDLRDDPTVGGVVLTVRDVTERRKLELELTHQAFHDSLTGLANRVLFKERVEHAVLRAQRDKALVGVLFIDLDDFKVVNDTLGHAVGDQLLVAVADRIAGVLRPHDTAARLGGDEFAALIEDATTPQELEAAAERIVNVLGAPFTVGGETVSGVASVGVGTTADATEASELLRQADLALYVAKGEGKGRWRRYQSDLHTVVLQRLELRGALDQALQDGQFVLQYQPIVDLASGLPVGFEALVRWAHPVRGIIAPDQFIDVAEESGLIVQIGGQVLEQALAAVARWQHQVPTGRLQYVSVNVSARQFRSPGFVDQVVEALERAGVAPNMLMLEITESLLLRDDDQVWADLAALRALGVRLAIDDFGTGYSSLSYLRHMPIDVLKIDKSFIDDMVASAQQRAVVAAIVRLAETLDLRVVAEGVEEQAHRDLLQRMGCPYGQGFLFARPLPEREAFALLAVDQTAAA